MSDNPCHQACDWTDGDEPVLADAGCCSPAAVRRDCEAPTIPTPECDEAAPVTEFDPVTEQFTVLTTLYDEQCSAILDDLGSPITTLLA